MDQYELYTVEDPPQFVAIRRVIRGGENIHYKPITDAIVRVVVVEARDSGALVSLLTEEVQLVGQTLKTFFIWSRYIVRHLS